jgi:hypothetical protein
VTASRCSTSEGIDRRAAFGEPVLVPGLGDRSGGLALAGQREVDVEPLAARGRGLERMTSLGRRRVAAAYLAICDSELNGEIYAGWTAA